MGICYRTTNPNSPWIVESQSLTSVFFVFGSFILLSFITSVAWMQMVANITVTAVFAVVFIIYCTFHRAT